MQTVLRKIHQHVTTSHNAHNNAREHKRSIAYLIAHLAEQTITLLPRPHIDGPIGVQRGVQQYKTLRNKGVIPADF